MDSRLKALVWQLSITLGVFAILIIGVMLVTGTPMSAFTPGGSDRSTSFSLDDISGVGSGLPANIPEQVTGTYSSTDVKQFKDPISGIECWIQTKSGAISCLRPEEKFYGGKPTEVYSDFLTGVVCFEYKKQFSCATEKK